MKDRSSVYSRFCRVRTQGSYLYEDFMPTDGTDVKVISFISDAEHSYDFVSLALFGLTFACGYSFAKLHLCCCMENIY